MSREPEMEFERAFHGDENREKVDLLHFDKQRVFLSPLGAESFFFFRKPKGGAHGEENRTSMFLAAQLPAPHVALVSAIMVDGLTPGMFDGTLEFIVGSKWQAEIPLFFYRYRPEHVLLHSVLIPEGTSFTVNLRMPQGRPRVWVFSRPVSSLVRIALCGSLIRARQ